MKFIETGLSMSYQLIYLQPSPNLITAKLSKNMIRLLQSIAASRCHSRLHYMHRAQQPEFFVSIVASVNGDDSPQLQRSQGQIKAFNASKCLSTTPTCQARHKASYSSTSCHMYDLGRGPVHPSVGWRTWPPRRARLRVQTPPFALARLVPPARARARGQRSLRPCRPAAATHGMAMAWWRARQPAGQLAVSPWNGEQGGVAARSLAVSSTEATRRLPRSHAPRLRSRHRR